jgi:predicted  nucleic acid-binding Zn-ribbon protein
MSSVPSWLPFAQTFEQELQRAGDEKELAVKKTEREIRALRSTLERLNSKNQRFKQSFTKVEGDSEDVAEMEQLQPVLEAVSDRRRQARTEVEHLSGDVASMQGSLGNLMQETASIDRQVQGLRKRVDGVQVCLFFWMRSECFRLENHDAPCVRRRSANTRAKWIERVRWRKK